MTGYCTLYLCDRQAILLREQRSRLTLAGAIGRGDDDRVAAAALRSLLARFPKDRLTVVVDSVDEELLVESLPPLGNRDLGELVARRLEHRRERRLLSWSAPRRLTIPGWQRGATVRVPVRIGLLASDGGTAPWLQAVLAAGARIDRIASPALLAAPVAARLGRGRNDGLLVTVGPAGIRQTLVTDGVARFTRLAQLFDDGSDVGAILAECRRTLEYLLMNQLVRRDAIASGRLRLWLVADGIGQGGALPATLAVDSASSIALSAVNAADLGAPRSDRPLSGGVGGAVLWTDRRLAGALAGGYESAAARRPLLIARLQRAIVGGAAGLTVASAVALATVELIAAWNDEQPARATNEWQELAEQRLSAAVSRLPISGSEMRRLAAGGPGAARAPDRSRRAAAAHRLGGGVVAGDPSRAPRMGPSSAAAGGAGAAASRDHYRSDDPAARDQARGQWRRRTLRGRAGGPLRMPGGVGEAAVRPRCGVRLQRPRPARIIIRGRCRRRAIGGQGRVHRPDATTAGGVSRDPQGSDRCRLTSFVPCARCWSSR